MIPAIWMEVLRVDDADDVRFSLDCLNICNNLAFDVGRAYVCDVLFEINHPFSHPEPVTVASTGLPT